MVPTRAKLTAMTKPAHTPILTAHDLRAALAGVPDECRVVVMDSEGRVMRCEVMALRVGDALVLMVCEDEFDLPT